MPDAAEFLEAPPKADDFLSTPASPTKAEDFLAGTPPGPSEAQIAKNLASESVEEQDFAFGKAMLMLNKINPPRESLLPKSAVDFLGKWSLPGEAEQLANKLGMTGTAKVAGGLRESTQDLIEFFTSIPGIALTVTGGGLPAAGKRVMAGGFTAYIAANFPEQWKAIQNAWHRGDTKEVTRIAANNVVNFTAAYQGGKFAIKGAEPVAAPKTKAEAIAPVAPLTAEALKQADTPIRGQVKVAAAKVGEAAATLGEEAAATAAEPHERISEVSRQLGADAKQRIESGRIAEPGYWLSEMLKKLSPEQTDLLKNQPEHVLEILHQFRERVTSDNFNQVVKMVRDHYGLDAAPDAPVPDFKQGKPLVLFGTPLTTQQKETSETAKAKTDEPKAPSGPVDTMVNKTPAGVGVASAKPSGDVAAFPTAEAGPPIKTYSSTEEARPDAVPLKQGDQAPVKFVSVQQGATHIGWYEPTKPFVSNDGGLYYPAKDGRVKISSSQIKNAGFEIPPSELSKFKEAGGTEKVSSQSIPPVIPEPSMAGPGSPAREEVPETGTGAEKYGVASRIRAERAQAGQVIPVEPGEGISALDSVEHGREMLAGGADPEKVMSDFESTKRLNAEDMAIARAHGEELFKQAREIEGKSGTDSDEYAAAFQRASDWDVRSKAMQTEWHKTGMAQQGETDLDTGSFTGLQREYKSQTGKEFTPQQAIRAKEKVARVKAASAKATASQQELIKEIGPTPQDKDLSAEEARVANIVREVDRNWLLKKTEAERKAMVAEQARKTALEKLNRLTEEKVQKTVDATHRARILRETEAERKALVKEAADKKALAEMYRKQAERIQKWIDRVKRDAAVRAAKAEREALNDPQKAIWDKIKGYIGQGMDDFNDIRNKVATDMGLPVDQVTRLIQQRPRAKFLADEVWRNQQTERYVKEQARRWVTNQTVPGYQKALRIVPRTLFSLKVGFHGTVALGTHAPMVAFQPRFWEAYVRDFGKMYKMVGSPTYYEQQIQDLVRRPNYITARRAGLINDPYSYEDFNNPGVSQYFGRLSGMGNRGYAVLKILRQDMFDQMWSKLPKTSQIPEVAEAISDGLNHATGVVKGKAPPGSNIALFAPRLEASRVAWLAADPAKAVDIFADWKNASLGEKTFAINQVKEKATVAATLFTMLAINQGFLSATGSKQKINMTDPMKGDFLKFKVGGLAISYGNPMITMARLPVRLAAIREKGGTGKLAKLIYPDESMANEVVKYIRSQLSPFASAVADIATKGDYANRPLPKMPLSGAQLPMPKRLEAQGVKPYTWPELTIEQVLPIPAEEAVRDVWSKGMGMSSKQMKEYWTALAKAMVMGATGSRINEDYELKHPSQPAPETNTTAGQ